MRISLRSKFNAAGVGVGSGMGHAPTSAAAAATGDCTPPLLLLDAAFPCGVCLSAGSSPSLSLLDCIRRTLGLLVAFLGAAFARVGADT